MPGGKSAKKPKLLAVQPLLKKHLWLEYEGERGRVFDVSPYIKGKWFGELEDEDYFKQVQLLPDVSGVEWPHGQDIAPHELYENSETLLQRKYARVIDLFAEKANIPKEEALDFFYSSVTYQLMSKGIADSHCLSDDYLAEDLVMELARKKNSIETKLDEADRQATSTRERLSNEAVFDSAKASAKGNRPTIKELFSDFEGEYESPEIDWGEPVGEEKLDKGDEES